MLRKSLPMKISLPAFDKKDAASMLGKLLGKIYSEHRHEIDADRWEANLEHVKKALQSEVYLRHIRRREQWEVEYSSSSAKLLLTISDNNVEWKLYTNVEKEPLDSAWGKYLRTFPIARMIVPEHGNIVEGSWSL
jgi:hypothetical protein